MLDPRVIFHLDGECPVETEGGETTAERVAGTDYTHGDYFRDHHEPTYIIDAPNGGYVVRVGDVEAIDTDW